MSSHCENCGKFLQRNVRTYAVTDPLVFDFVKNNQVAEHARNRKICEPSRLTSSSRIWKACRDKYERSRISVSRRSQEIESVAGRSRAREQPIQVREEEGGYSDETEIMSGLGSLSVSQSSSSDTEYEEDEIECGDEDFENILVETESPSTMVTLSSNSSCIFRCRDANNQLTRVSNKIRNKVLVKYRIYIPKGARVCMSAHSDEDYES